MNRQMMATAVTLGQIQQQLATVADNIANVGTTGFKSRSAEFSDLLFQQIRNMDPTEDRTDQTNRLTPSGIRAGSGTRVGDAQLDLAEGSIKQTDNPLDVTLSADHQFFTVAGPNGEGTAYTRSGAFRTEPDPADANRLRLLTESGQAVLDSAGRAIELPAHYSDVHIDGAGTITATMANGRRINAGRLGRVTILRPQLLENRGGGMYTLTDLGRLGIGLNQVARAVPTNDTSVVQGKLENSNVDLTKEMTDLINLQHNYQLNARSITLSDQMAGLINGMLR